MVYKFDVKRMAEALQKGAIMMAVHCEACGAPLFRYKTGRIECANCGKLYRYAPGSTSIEELSKLEYSREEALSLLREVEKHLFRVEDELRMKSIVETLKKLRDELAGTG